MKTLVYNYLTIFLFCTIPLNLWAHDGKLKGKYTKEKTIKKEYQVNADALLKVNNSYGNLNITSWSENRVLIEVHIKTNGNASWTILPWILTRTVVWSPQRLFLIPTKIVGAGTGARTIM